MASASLESAHNRGRSEYFDGTLPGDVVAALVRNLDADRRPGQARELDFTPWGGAYTRVPVDATALPHRDPRFLLKHTVAVAADASSRDRETARGWLHHSWAIVHPCGSSGVYPNFPDPDLTSWADAYHGPNIECLRRVKAAYDPDGFFRFHQAIPHPATGHHDERIHDGAAADVRRLFTGANYASLATVLPGSPAQHRAVAGGSRERAAACSAWRVPR